MSTLDSSINASAATVTTDFYRRFRPSVGDEQHYLRVGRWFSLLFAAMMVGVSLYIHEARTDTLMDVQTVVYSVVSAGLLSLFLLGFLTVRVGSRVAFIATASTVLLVAFWLFLTTEVGAQAFPHLAGLLPNKFWIGVLPHIFLLAVGGLLALFIRRRSNRSLENLTIWTRTPETD
jgi:SSS family solute:Na+ symporter